VENYLKSCKQIAEFVLHSCKVHQLGPSIKPSVIFVSLEKPNTLSTQGLHGFRQKLLTQAQVLDEDSGNYRKQMVFLL
jgi:hypothetical protein